MELERRGRLGQWKGWGNRTMREDLAHETEAWLLVGPATKRAEKSRMRREPHVRMCVQRETVPPK